jgi:HD-like signal output (HDOD) protein
VSASIQADVLTPGVGADQYIDRSKNLPPAPTVVTELLELFSNPNQDLDRIVELIRYDPSLTAKILK